MPKQRVDPVIRFWAKVDKSGGPDACWPWMGSRNPKTGYGRCHWNGRQQGTHRIAEELTRGPLPPKMQALHTCDNRPCCNPAHLFRGTNAENTADRNAKGRQAKGQAVGTARISDDTALAIKRRLAAGEGVTRLAREYGVAQSAVSSIRSGRIRAWQQI